MATGGGGGGSFFLLRLSLQIGILRSVEETSFLTSQPNQSAVTTLLSRYDRQARCGRPGLQGLGSNGVSYPSPCPSSGPGTSVPCG